MRTFSYASPLPVKVQIWRSHHSIRYSRKPHAARKLHGAMFYRTGFMADGSFILQKYAFSTFFAYVTLTYTQWPSYANLTRISWRYARCANMNFRRQGFESCRQTDRHTDRQTDMTEITYHAASRMVSSSCEVQLMFKNVQE